MLTVTDAWKTTYPGAAVGVLAMESVRNPQNHAGLDQKKEELEAALRDQFQGRDKAALKALPTIQAYQAFYKRFKKTYHVLLQLQSVALKGKPIPRVAALVESMFMAELKNQLLTAGHDMAKVIAPITLNVAQGDERFTRINDQEQELKAGDMFIADAEGILSSVIYGPDRRTRITADTQQVIFTTYAPQGITATLVRQHLEDIQANVLQVSPQARTLHLRVYGSQ